jgi:NTP pyrophosphatase (non-canonical NTP hydrolase)
MTHPVLKPHPTLADIQDYIAQTLQHRKLDDSSLQDEFILLVEEVGELAKALRQHTGHKMGSEAPPQNLAHEAADVLWMLLATCNKLGIDLEAALRQKEEHNKTRTWQ